MEVFFLLFQSNFITLDNYFLLGLARGVQKKLAEELCSVITNCNNLRPNYIQYPFYTFHVVNEKNSLGNNKNKINTICPPMQRLSVIRNTKNLVSFTGCFIHPALCIPAILAGIYVIKPSINKILYYNSLVKILYRPKWKSL